MSMSTRELLMDAVLTQIGEDVASDNWSAIHELLFRLSDRDLEAYLSKGHDENN